MRAIARSVVILVALAVGAPGLAWAQAPGAGLAGTSHDFTGAGPVTATQTVGLCTFCHTPHRAFQTKLLWNHELSLETYGWSDTTVTTNGTLLPTFDSSWQGISKNCLSCHDGTVAIGDVAWFNATGPVNLQTLQHNDPLDPFLITFNNGPGGDMFGNHPVAHPFPFNAQPSTYNGTTSGSTVVASGWQLDPQSLGIRLFNDNAGNVSAGAVQGSTGIECSSCHDPHNGPGVLDVRFLRGTLTGNDTQYICLKCHVK